MRPLKQALIGTAAAGAIALGLLLAIGQAHADYMRHHTCFRLGGVLNCNTTWSQTPEPRQLTEQEQAESAERERLWLNRCKPTFKQDDLGVVRYVYAAPGCDLGRWMD